MSTIAIIGATGYAGGHIQAAAMSRGHRVIAVSRRASTGAAVVDVDVRQGSIEDRELLQRVFAPTGRACSTPPSFPRPTGPRRAPTPTCSTCCAPMTPVPTGST